jgi:hypothetical protein
MHLPKVAYYFLVGTGLAMMIMDALRLGLKA